MKIGKPDQAFDICFEEDKLRKEQQIMEKPLSSSNKKISNWINPLALQRWESKWTKKDFTGGLTQYRLVAKLGTYIHTTQPNSILASVELVVIQG